MPEKSISNGQQNLLFLSMPVYHGSCASKAMHLNQWSDKINKIHLYIKILYIFCYLLSTLVNISWKLHFGKRENWFLFLFFSSSYWVGQHLQWFLLWRLHAKQPQQSKDLDWKLDWLVSTCSVLLFYILKISFFPLNLILETTQSRFKAWDKADPHRPAEDVAYAVARFFQRQGTAQNYYMVRIS